jgi:hypothetical protein
MAAAGVSERPTDSFGLWVNGGTDAHHQMNRRLRRNLDNGHKQLVRVGGLYMVSPGYFGIAKYKWSPRHIEEVLQTIQMLSDHIFSS